MERNVEGETILKIYKSNVLNNFTTHLKRCTIFSEQFQESWICFRDCKGKILFTNIVNVEFMSLSVFNLLLFNLFSMHIKKIREYSFPGLLVDCHNTNNNIVVGQRK